MKHLKQYFISQIVFAIIILFSSNFLYAFPNCMQNGATFQLHILNKSWQYYEGISQKTDTISLDKVNLEQDSLLCITEKDIELYNWSNQSIFFNQNILDKLKNFLLANQEKIKGSSMNLKKMRHTLAFIVVFKNLKMFAGVVNEGYAPGYSVPTLFFQYYANGDISIIIRPLKTFVSETTGYMKLDNSLKQIIEKPEIRDFFLKLNKLTYNNEPSCVKNWLPTKKCNLNFLNQQR